MTETTDTYLLLRAFVDELARCGLAGACTSPGSRSTPLVLTLARQRGLRCWSHVDERVAGFFAVGVAKQTGRPAAVACTSGTAAAHYLPAVIEAREARVPLIVLTGYDDTELAVSCMRDGVVDYLVKPVNGERLRAAVGRLKLVSRPPRDQFAAKQ